VPTNEKANADATNVDPAGLASLVNAMFDSRIPVIHRLGIRILAIPRPQLSTVEIGQMPNVFGRRGANNS
jgi:hypothetical protein